MSDGGGVPRAGAPDPPRSPIQLHADPLGSLFSWFVLAGLCELTARGNIDLRFDGERTDSATCSRCRTPVDRRLVSILTRAGLRDPDATTARDAREARRANRRERSPVNERRTVFLRGLRIIGSYVAMHPLPFGIAVCGAAVYAAATVASTIVLGRITDRVVLPAFSGGVARGTVAIAAVAVVGVGLIKGAGIVARRYFAGMTNFRVQRTLRSRVIDRYQELPLAFHRSRPTGELLAHTEGDVDAATDVINPLPYSVAVILLVVFASVSLIVTDPFLAVIGCLILPGLAVLNRIYTRRAEEPATRAQELVGEVSAVAHESFDGALVVKTLGRDRAEVQRMTSEARRLRDERIRLGRMRASFEPVFQALPNLGIVVLLAVGAWRVSSGTITTGTLVQFISLFLLLAFPMRLIGFVLSDIPRAVVGKERLDGVMAEPLSMHPAAERLPLPDGPLGVSVRSVSFSYDGPPVLEDVSFEVAPLETVALVGPTGAGKSTLAELLIRLADPDGGSIRLGGVDLRHANPAHLRASAAIAFQESFLFATTITENISLGSDATLDEIREAARIARADRFISELPRGYDTVVGERGITLSGGQRQRVALARALLQRPRLLVLDDATSAVDPSVEAAILRRLVRDVEATIVVVAYRVSTIALADRVVLLSGGRVAAAGPHDELMSHAPYRAMVQAYERRAS
jgi:ATP-binding cassette, subfamily B, bacterial